MKSFLFAFVILVTFPQQIFASTCPPPPVPLRQLVERSEFIIIGTVRSNVKATTADYNTLKTELEVQQVLQGHIKTKTIPLDLRIWMILSMAQQPVAGEQLMVFVNFSEEKQAYIPSSYQSSYKILDKDGINAYRQRIKEIQAIQSLKNEKRRDQLTIDWLIDCAENPYTHWDGAYELVPYSQFLGSYDEEKGDYVQRIMLSEPQKQRVRNLLLSLTEIEHIDVRLIDTISGWEDVEIQRLVVNYLKSIDQEGLWQQSFLMHRIATTFQRKDLSEAMEKWNNLSYDDDWQEQVNSVAVEFVKLL